VGAGGGSVARVGVGAAIGSLSGWSSCWLAV
jgi:hypothetical protein